MQLTRRGSFAGLLVASPALFAASRAQATQDVTLADAVASPLRNPSFRARDRYRHPAELLAFFRLKPEDSVLEVEPGGGYWTEILVPYLARSGHYTAALPTGTAFAQREAQAFLNKLHGDEAVYSTVAVELFGPQGGFGAPASFDLILSFRNLHDWMADGSAQAMLGGIYAALKPGGVFGIEDHRAPTNVPQDPRAKDGYVRQDYARTLIEAAGFRFAASSEIGANPLDTKNYPDGVWDLPPVLRQKSVNRGKYLAIGESDRWTMRFLKPA